jgi:hypothetical protein
MPVNRKRWFLFFSAIQKRNIEDALNYKPEKPELTLADAAKRFNQKIDSLSHAPHTERERALDKNRRIIFERLHTLLGEIKEELTALIPQAKAQLNLERCFPNDENHALYSQQISMYAKTQSYYFNRNLPRGWFKLQFILAGNKHHDLIISVHHFGFYDSEIAVSAFLEFSGSNTERVTTPINLKPFTLSLEGNSSQSVKNLERYVRDIVKVGLTVIANELP